MAPELDLASLRALILTPNRRDADIALGILTEAGIGAAAVSDLEAFCAQLDCGAGFALIAEEALARADLTCLSAWVTRQPVWSDLPFILLTGRTKGGLERNPLGGRLMRILGNVSFVERPFHPMTLVSMSEAALRARRRQYQARQMLEDRDAAAAALRRGEEALRHANEALEARVADRTRQLAETNARLTAEILQREAVQDALLQSQKMEAVGQLTGGIAHDFNNLLTAIVGNVDLIARRSDDDRIQRMAGNAREAVDRAAKLTSQLLAFSRSQRLHLSPVAVDTVIAGMSDLLSRSIGPLIDIRTELAAGDVDALGDANQVELAVLNLAINARDAMPDGGVLTIRTGQTDQQGAGDGGHEGRYVSISVGDTGSGIPEAALSKVFDPFFTTKPVGKGTGLGLSQVYGIATQSGGRVSIDTAQGQGTTVTMLLPLLTAPAEAVAQAAPSPEPLMIAGAGEKVLVIDDDPDVRRFIVTCLSAVGYAVTEAADGPAGLARLGDDRPDLLIVDFAMPGMNGAEVAMAARDLRPGLSILMASGYSETDAVARAVDIGALLRKPFDVRGLVGAVRTALSEPA